MAPAPVAHPITAKPTVFIKHKASPLRLVLIRMFVVGTGVPDGPQNTNFGRDIVFSADLCYNEVNEKAFLREEGGTA